MTENRMLAVITGAASGIGAGLAVEASRRGYRVLMADMNEAVLAERAESIDHAVAFPADVTKQSDLDALADRADELGGVDLLFNNAGVMSMGFSWEISAEDWQQGFDVNVHGIVNSLRSFVPRMITRGTEARIINTASVGGFLTSPLMSPYSASKFAVVALTEALAFELDSLKVPISVSLLAPGPVKTDMLSFSFSKGVNPATQQLVERLKSLSEIEGLEPSELAKRVFDAVECGEYWIIPQPDRLDSKLENRQKMILSRKNPTL